MAKIYKIPTLISASTKFSLIGITAQATRAKVIVIMGAMIKITLFALAGIIISFKIYLSASANVWNKPKGPTTFGPRLFELNPKLFCQTILS